MGKRIRSFFKHKLYPLYLRFRRRLVKWHILKPYHTPAKATTGTMAIYVDRRGWDHWSGTREKPVYRVQEAMDMTPHIVCHDVLVVIDTGTKVPVS